MNEACLVQGEYQLFVFLFVALLLAVVGEDDVLVDLLMYVLLDRADSQEAVRDQLEVLDHGF